ncbi:AAA family ATPase [Streptomyces microflavus]|uniref:AAA family ATPase n=1 Tax=Streptomyces microflavus TaxID=1919 RepID=UPI0033B092AB
MRHRRHPIVAVLKRLIGRSEELEVLRSSARTAARGIPRIVLISGADGIGKTVLVEKFAEQASKEFTVLRAWDVPPRPDLPFYTVTGLLTGGGVYPAATPREGTAAPQLSVLSMGAAFIGLLDSLLKDAPLLRWLDEAHKIDVESLRAIGFALLRQRAERMLTIVCTKNPTQTTRDMGLADLTPELEHIQLRGFRLDETRDFVEDRTSRPQSRDKLRGLAAWSDGNPLFLEAAVGAFGADLPDEPSTASVPPSLSDAVGAWSLSFAPATVPLLNELLDSEEVGAAADVLEDQHAALWVPGVVPALTLVHAGQRDALDAAVPLAERNRMHLRTARVLEPPASWRHKVATAETYDSVLAGELRDAAAREVRAGHAALAADYLFASSQVDPDAERRQESLVTAVRLHVTEGSPRTALQHEDAVLESPDGPQRDEALGLLGLARGEPSRARTYLDRAYERFTARGDRVRAASAAAELGIAEGSLGLGRESLKSSRFALEHARDETVKGMAQANLGYAHALIDGPAAGLDHLGHLPDPAVRVPSTHTDAAHLPGHVPQPRRRPHGWCPRPHRGSPTARRGSVEHQQRLGTDLCPLVPLGPRRVAGRPAKPVRGTGHHAHHRSAQRLWLPV